MPAITISKRTVDQAAPGERDIFLWDDRLRGFGLKVTPAGAKVYIVQYRTGGRGSPTKRVTIGRHGAPWTPDQARVRAKALLGKVASGGDPAAEARAERQAAKRQQTINAERTVEAFATRWFKAQRRDGKRSADEVERSFKRHLYPELGARDVATITKADAHAVYDRLADAGHAPMGHQLCRNLKALLSFAVERELIAVNPLLRIKLPKLEPRARILIQFHPERAPDPAELVAVWRASDQLPEPRGDFVKVLILTLAREDEVAGMEWAEVDGAVWRVPAARHKGKLGYGVPLAPAVVELIEAQPREREIAGRMVPNEYVFAGRGGRPIGDFSQLKAGLEELSGVTGWRLHDLRRTGSSWIEEEFGREIMHACLGHSLGSRLAETYARGPGFRRKRRALERWADFVTNAVAGISGDNVVALPGRR